MRRKNSAEMLDVLRRMSQDQKAKRARELERPEPPLPPSPRRAPVSPPADLPRLDRSGAGRPAGEEGSSLFAGPSRLKHGDEPAGDRPRRSFLSVLSGGRHGMAPGETGAPLESAPIGAAPIGSKAESAASAGRKGPFPAEAELAGPFPTVPFPAVPFPVEGTVESGVRSAEEEPSPEEVAAVESRHRKAAGDDGLLVDPGDGRRPMEVGVAGLGVLEGQAEGAFPPVSGDEPPRAADSPSAPASGQTWDESPAASRQPPALSSSESAPRRPLFGLAPEGSRFQTILSRALRAVVGEEFSGSLRRRVEVRLLTIGLYAAVAIMAMLAVALFMNQRDRERRTELEKVIGETPETGAGQTPVLPAFDIVPQGRASPDVRNAVAAVRPPAPAAGEAVPPPGQAAEPPPPGAGPAAAPAGAGQVWTGAKGPEGWYIQIQSMVSAEHATLIVDHVQKLGYKSVWQRPNKSGFFILRLGPYGTKETALTEMEGFKARMKTDPLRKPRLDWTKPFVLEIKALKTGA